MLVKCVFRQLCFLQAFVKSILRDDGFVVINKSVSVFLRAKRFG